MTMTSQGKLRPDLLADVADDIEGVLGPPRSVAEVGVDRDLREVVSVIRNFLLPRLSGPRRPFKVAFAGPTGGGKSTLVNSVVGRRVTRSGPLRPTTMKPLLYTSQKYADAESMGSVDADVATGDAPILKLISLIDTPDIDSTNTRNHQVARDVVAGADVVVFVASALRYADLVPWEMLRFVQRRGVPVIFVLNRVTRETTGAMVDYRSRLRAEGMIGPVLTVMEHRMPVEGILPLSAIGPLRDEILEVIGDLDHERGMKSCMEAVRSDLVGVSQKINADLVRVERVAEHLAGGLIDAGEGMDLALEWQRRRDSLGGVVNSVFRRQWARAELAKLESEIRNGLISLVEKDLRVFALARGQLVIDLTESVTLDERLESVDGAVEDWLSALVPSDGSLSARRLGVSRAIEGFCSVVEGGSGDDAPTEHLAAQIREIYESLASEIVSSTHDAALLDVVNRARARLRPEPALSRSLSGW